MRYAVNFFAIGLGALIGAGFVRFNEHLPYGLAMMYGGMLVLVPLTLYLEATNARR